MKASYEYSPGVFQNEWSSRFWNSGGLASTNVRTKSMKFQITQKFVILNWTQKHSHFYKCPCFWVQFILRHPLFLFKRNKLTPYLQLLLWV